MAVPTILLDRLDDLLDAFRYIERWEEPGRLLPDFKTLKFGWPNWLDIPAPEILVNNEPMVAGTDYTVDATNGQVVFAADQDASNTFRGNYVFRLIPRTQCATFFEIALSQANIKKPQSNFGWDSIPENWMGVLVLGAYKYAADAILARLGTFRYQRLFEDPNRLSTELRANSAEFSAAWSEALATIKRRGMVLPQGAAGFDRGKIPWMIDETNWGQFAIAR